MCWVRSQEFNTSHVFFIISWKEHGQWGGGELVFTLWIKLKIHYWCHLAFGLQRPKTGHMWDLNWTSAFSAYSTSFFFLTNISKLVPFKLMYWVDSVCGEKVRPQRQQLSVQIRWLIWVGVSSKQLVKLEIDERSNHRLLLVLSTNFPGWEPQRQLEFPVDSQQLLPLFQPQVFWSACTPAILDCREWQF